MPMCNLFPAKYKVRQPLSAEHGKEYHHRLLSGNFLKGNCRINVRVLCTHISSRCKRSIIYGKLAMHERHNDTLKFVPHFCIYRKLNLEEDCYVRMCNLVPLSTSKGIPYRQRMAKNDVTVRYNPVPDFKIINL